MTLTKAEALFHLTEFEQALLHFHNGLVGVCRITKQSKEEKQPLLGRRLILAGFGSWQRILQPGNQEVSPDTSTTPSKKYLPGLPSPRNKEISVALQSKTKTTKELLDDVASFSNSR